MGGTSCARYLEYRQTHSDADKISYHFSLGLMSGLNMSRMLSGLDARNINDGRGPTIGAVTAAMVAYCQQHPEDGYAFGVTWQVYRQLPLLPGSQERWQRRRGM